MTEYDNTNRWVLFKNDRKERDTHPDYTGTLNVDGVEYFLNAWLKSGSKGKFFSGTIKPKDNRANQKPQRSRQEESRSRRGDLDDDIPF